MAEEKEEKEGVEWGELFGHAIRFLILTWSLSMMTLGYMGKVRIDGAFTARFSFGSTWFIRDLSRKQEKWSK